MNIALLSAHQRVCVRTVLVLVSALALSGVLEAQTGYVHFESPAMHPVQVSPDGTRLAVAHAHDQRVAIYSLAVPSQPVLWREIPVGLEPVSVRFRTDDELWVVNWLSDSISVISLRRGAVIATITVDDEPADVVFAGNPERAFVTATTRDRVLVLDAARRTSLGVIAIPAKDPRALAVDGTRSKVFVLSARSGNGTTVVPAAQAPSPPPPTNPALPAAPQQGLIVRADDPAWSALNTILPDEDLFEINANSLAITSRVRAIGTTNFDLAVHPTSGEVFIANTDARNLVRFEPALRAHAIHSRVTKIAPNGTRATFELNPTVSYTQLPDPAGAALALAEPTGLALDAIQGRLYVAAQGTDRIAVMTTAGQILARIELGTPGAASNARAKKGPRALALHPSAPVLYAALHLAGSVAVIDTNTLGLIRELPFAFDPVPPVVRVGRGFLYDAKLSGNGTMSCAACHIDGDMDGLAWDLGDPAGDFDPAPLGQTYPFNLFLQPYHPMKGPMTTQSLRGLRGMRPFHWRGDRIDFEHFNSAFDKLLGGTEISPSEMLEFKAFVMELEFPPNPNQLRDRSYATVPASTNAAVGFDTFRNFSIGGTPIGTQTCATCHVLPSGSNRVVISSQLMGQTQIQVKVPQLRNLYRKVGYERGVPSKLGFGYMHDGAVDSLSSFLSLPTFSFWPSSEMDDVEQFLLAFDSGTAPTVGWQFDVHFSNASSTAVLADLTLLEQHAALQNCDAIAKGHLDGEEIGLWFETATSRYVASRTALGTFTRNELLNFARNRRATLTFTGVARSTGRRAGVDRDADGVLDGDEGVQPYGAGTTGCALKLRANGEPRFGSRGFALAIEGAAPGAIGMLLLGTARTSFSALGVELLVDPASVGFIAVSVLADAHGVALQSLPIARNPLLIGLDVDFQAIFPATCGSQGLAASGGLEITLRP